MLKGKRFTKSMAILLALVMLIGVLPGAVLADFDVLDIEDQTVFGLELNSDEAEVTDDGDYSFNNVVIGNSIRDSAQMRNSKEELDYVEAVAEMLTRKEGLQVEGNPSDTAYVYVWLQSMPEALERVYEREGMRNSRYENVRGRGERARSDIRRSSRVNITHEFSGLFSGFALEATIADLEAIASMEGVYAVTPMEYLYRMDVNEYIPDPDYTTVGNAGAREIMEIADLHAAGIDGRDVKVGVIDDGVDRTHPDLVGAYVAGWNFTRSDGNTTPGSSTGMGSNTHGTHVAGTIASQGLTSLGVAPGVQLYNGQVFGAGGTGATAANIQTALEVFAGINTNHASITQGGLGKVDVVNMSLGNDAHTVYAADHFTRNNAVVAGLIVVNSAGNNAYPQANTTQRNNYTLGSGAVALPISVAAAQHGGNKILAYAPTVVSERGTGTFNFFCENGDSATSGVFRDGSFGSLEPRSVAFTPASADIAWGPYPGSPFTINPLVYHEGLGYEVFNASAHIVPAPGQGSEMDEGGMRALQAMTPGSLAGKILVVYRGQNFLDYKGQALRLGAGGLLIINRDEAIIGNLNIGSETSARDLLIFSAPASVKQIMYDLSQDGATLYLNPGPLLDAKHPLEPADFSSIGPTNEPGHIKPDITAPGWSILSTMTLGGLTEMSGTSMSGPWVAGVAALVKQAYPDATPAEVKARIMNTADPDIIKPLKGRLSVGNGMYFNPAGTQSSVFEQGSGFVNPKRAVGFGDYGDVYITVAHDQIPTGQGTASNPTLFTSAEMASFSFGQSNADSVTRKLTATVFGGEIEEIKIRYNQDTRYSNKNLDLSVVAKFEITDDDTFDLWLEVGANATFNARVGGNLYEGLVIVTVDSEDFVLPWATRVMPAVGQFYGFVGLSQRTIISSSNSNTVKSAATANAATTIGRDASRSTFYYYWLGTIPTNIQVVLLDPDDPETVLYNVGTIAQPAVADRVGTGILNYSSHLFNRTATRRNPDGTTTANAVIADGAYLIGSIVGGTLYAYLDVGVVYTSGTGDMAVQLTFDTDETGRIAVSGNPDVTTAKVSGRIYSPAIALAQEYGFVYSDPSDVLYEQYFYEIDQSFNMLAWNATADMWISQAGEVTNFYIPPGATSINDLWICDADGFFSLDVPVSQITKDGGWVFANGTNRTVVGVESVFWHHGRSSGINLIIINIPAEDGWNLVGANKSPGVANLQFGHVQKTVTFDSAGGSAVAPMIVDDWKTMTPPAPPTLYGYSFAGWTLDDELFDFENTLIIEDITLVATWEIVPISWLRIGQPVENSDPVLAAPMIQIGRNGSIDLLAIVGEGTLPIGIVWTVNNPNLASIEFDEDGNAVKVFTKAASGNVTVTARAPSGVTHSIILRVV